MRSRTNCPKKRFRTSSKMDKALYQMLYYYYYYYYSSFPPFLPSLVPSILPSFLPSFLPPFLPSSLPPSLPSFLPSFLVEFSFNGLARLAQTVEHQTWTRLGPVSSVFKVRLEGGAFEEQTGSRCRTACRKLCSNTFPFGQVNNNFLVQNSNNYLQPNFCFQKSWQLVYFGTLVHQW